MERDRLKSKLKRQAFKNTLFVFLGVGALVVLLALYGQQLLISFSLFLTPRDTTESTNTTADAGFVAAPDLNPVEDATNSAKIAITGSTSVDKSTVKLYINGVLADTKKVTSKNEFAFTNVELEEGDNEIKAKTITEDDKESGFSTPLYVVFSNKAPELTIDYPQDGQTLKNNEQTLTGKTNAGSTVTVNGFRAIVQPGGNFSYRIKLNDGGNTIKITSIDSAGNKTEKEINVTYSP